MNSLLGKWVMLGALSVVFVITSVYARLPVRLTANIADTLVSTKMSHSDMVTPMVTSKIMVTKSIVTNVTSMSPSVSPIVPMNKEAKQSLTPGPTAETSSPVTMGLISSPPLITPSPLSGIVTSVIINEIGWMGTSAQANDEWIELFNPASSPVDLNNWRLRSADDSPNIMLSGSIAAHGYYLIERTNDTTIADIPAQLVTSFGRGGLNNGGEQLTLSDASGKAVDAVDAKNGWFAGDNTAKTSMERISPEANGSQLSSWKANDQATRTGHDSKGNFINGTPGAPNSQKGL